MRMFWFLLKSEGENECLEWNELSFPQSNQMEILESTKHVSKTEKKNAEIVKILQNINVDFSTQSHSAWWIKTPQKSFGISASINLTHMESML